MEKNLSRYPVVDVLKAVAAQIIVWHHFAAYGPLSEWLHLTLPLLAGWLYDYGRMAVQVFLVLGGYLAAMSLTHHHKPWRRPLATIARRYVRLTGPYAVAVALAVICAAIARVWIDDSFVPALPSWHSLAAHVLLLQGILHIDGLSAGVWYVAIDFQLYASLVLVLWAAQGRRFRQWTWVLALTGLSLLVFNRHADLDNWAIYFWGSYGLGALAWWGSSTLRQRDSLAAFGIAMLICLCALWWDFRIRVGLAGITAVVLWRWGQATRGLPDRLQRTVSAWSQRSYALFLVHFPVLMVVNAVYASVGHPDSPWGPGFIACGWVLSMAAAHWLHRRVEMPLHAVANTSFGLSRP